MKSLHIIRSADDHLASRVIGRCTAGEDAVLLVQDGVYGAFPGGTIKLFACREDLAAREIAKDCQVVSYDEIAKLVLEYDRTIVW